MSTTSTRARTTSTTGPGTAPPLPADLDQVLRRMRLPYLRTAAPEVLAFDSRMPTNSSSRPW